MRTSTSFVHLLLILLPIMLQLQLLVPCQSFRSFQAFSRRSSIPLSMTSHSETSRRMGELTAPEQKVFDFMEELHKSDVLFRIVVVGKGAILESTAKLGPKLSISQSPATGANLLTLASSDQSFEFHLQLSQVSKIVVLSKETPKKVLRIIRLLDEKGDSMSSLILTDESEASTAWFQGLLEKFGEEIQL